MKFRGMAVGVTAPTIAALSIVPTPALGQGAGWYVGVDGGWSSLQTLKFTAIGTPFTATLKQGFVAGGNAGFEFRSGLRIEGELAYRRHAFQNLSFPDPQLPGGGGFGISNTGTIVVPGGIYASISTFTGGITNSGVVAPTASKPGDPTIPLTGHIDSLAVMANLLYDFRPARVWTPYVGAGVGGARLSMDASAGSPFSGTLANTSDWQFAYQGIVGIKYTFSGRWSVDLDYRYFATTDPTFKDVSGHPFKPQYHTHNVLLGIVYRFGSPKR